jgi:sulfate/thiosulfate transport system ATP-binding protein
MGIQINHISKTFLPVTSSAEPFQAVKDVTFDVPKGQMVALLGPSGSGKSTLLRIIAGLEKPDCGEIYLEGREVSRCSSKERHVGFVFQHYALFKHMTVWKNIAFGLEVNHYPKHEIYERMDQFLDLIQLKGYEDRYPSQLSGGQRQRVALARALAPHPRFLLLDEPFGALDAKVRRNLAIQLRKLHKDVKTTSVFVTHDQEEAFELADTIVLINHGAVEQIGTAEEIYDHPCSRFVASFIGNVNVIEGHIDRQMVQIGPDRLTVPGILPAQSTGDIVLLVRPENIEWRTEPDPGFMAATIRAAAFRGDRYEIILDLAGIELRLISDKTRGKRSEWTAGNQLFIRFSQYAIFGADDGHAALWAKMQSLGYIE